MARPYAACLRDMPIPTDCMANPQWPPIMQELAASIGAYDTLLIVDAFSGQDIYIPTDPSKNPFTGIIAPDKAAIISHVFSAERITIPQGNRWVEQAKRQGIIASVRQKQLTVIEAAAMLGKDRRFVYRLLNRTDEGLHHTPMVLISRKSDPRQIDMFEDTGTA